jgi:ribosomal protein S18 acetylase RimI-like enzyme
LEDSLSSEYRIRRAVPEDQTAAYYVCLKTGDHGRDGEPFYQEDPDALGRIYVGPYLAFEPELSWVLEDAQGVCGYALGTLDSRRFYQRYDRDWRPELCRQFPMPTGAPESWTRAQMVHSLYHHPEYFCPEPYQHYPSHMHIDLLERGRGRGFGTKMMQQIMEQLQNQGSPGTHLGVSPQNDSAIRFYLKLGFRELTRLGNNISGCVYLGKRFC